MLLSFSLLPYPLLHFCSAGHMIGAQECLQKVLENSWEEHISQSLNCLFICLFTSLSASVGTMWGLLVGYIANPVWPFKSHMISALPT